MPFGLRLPSSQLVFVKDAGTPEALGHSAQPLWPLDLRLLPVHRTRNLGSLVDEYVAFLTRFFFGGWGGGERR